MKATWKNVVPGMVSLLADPLELYQVRNRINHSLPLVKRAAFSSCDTHLHESIKIAANRLLVSRNGKLNLRQTLIE